MTSLSQHQQQWADHRDGLEREIRVLLVESEQQPHDQLLGLLESECICVSPARDGAAALAAIEHTPHALVITAEQLEGMKGAALIRQVRLQARQIDALVLSAAPSLELALQAFDLRLLDIYTKPFDDVEALRDQIRDAIRRCVDRQMRTYVLNQLRDVLSQLEPDARLRTTAALERRLAAFKSALSHGDRVLVLEHEDADLRQLSEQLLRLGLYVETADDLLQATTRIARHGIWLAVVDVSAADNLLETLTQLQRADPHVDLALVTSQPNIEAALIALRHGVSSYLPWPECVGDLLPRVRDILSRGRRSRLLDNLFLELYRETNRMLDPDVGSVEFERFRRLIGLERVLGVESTAAPSVDADVTPRESFDGALDSLMIAFEQEANTDGADGADIDAPPRNRRTTDRIPEAQFIRYRPRGSTTGILAFLGDLSEGGAFIRSAELLSPGTLLEVDFNLALDQQGFLVRCRAQVAWVARDDRQSPLGPGIGVKFLDPPQDVADLLHRVVIQRE